eukprot:TCALIF_08537-PA protein Name:"Similar to Hmcn2 Hemicentin-2 (Mus musculus)" AED:0.16 eAED:0.19 QI:0/-1/0/1/-1/1/1/0/1771
MNTSREASTKESKSPLRARISGLTNGDLVSSRDEPTLTCELETRGKETIDWYLNGSQVSSGRDFSVTNGQDGKLECRSRFGDQVSLAFVYLIGSVLEGEEIPSNPIELTLSKFGNPTLIKNSSLTLICSYDILESNVTSPQIEWILNGQPMPTNNPNIKVETDSEEQVSRLKIAQLQPSQDGNFGCLASQSDRGFSRYQELSVQVRYGPVFTSKPPPTQMVQYGQDFVLKCVADAYPPPTVIWKLNGTDINDLKTKDSFQRLGDQISVKAAEPDLVGEFRCFVQNEMSEIQALAQVQLAWELPIIVTDSLPELVILEDGGINLHCDATGHPEPQVAWIRDESENVRFQGNVLEISEAKFEEHNGHWTCMATNVFGSSQRRIVQVTVIRRSQIFANETRILGHLNTNLTLNCAHYTDPRVSQTLMWQKNHQSLSSSTNLTELFLPRIGLGAAGDYICNVSTPFDSATHTWSVEVIQVPEILPLPSEVKTLRGRNVSLTCVANGIPTPKISWFRTGKSGSQDPVTNNPTLKVDMSVNDAGAPRNFKCFASNLHGNTTREVSIIPVKPTVMTMANNTKHDLPAGQSITLSCSANIDPLLAPRSNRVWTKNNERLNFPADETFEISYLRAEHSGSYVCTIHTEVDTIIISQSVTVQAKAPKILTKVKHVGVLIGSQVELNCSSEGLPKPEVTWKNASVTVGSSAHLRLKNVSKADEGVFSCWAVNEYGRDQHEVSIQVFKPITVLQSPKDQLTDSLSKVIFECRFDIDERLVNETRIRWIHNGELDMTNSSKKISRGRAIIQDNVLKTNEGTYTCEASNRLETLNVTARLTVLGEAPLFISTEKDVRGLEDSNATIACQANGLPIPNITWTKDGKNILGPSAERFVMSTLGDLSIRSVRLEDQGTYVCQARNIYGSIETLSELQVIKKAAQDSRGLTRELTKSVHDNVTLPCDVSYDPRIHEETEFIWKREGQEKHLLTNDKYKIMKNTSLFINQLTLEDKGVYECTVKTPFESITVKVSLHISGEAPRILSELDKKTLYEGDNLRLKCLVRGVPTPKLDWLFNGNILGPEVLEFLPTGSDEFMEAHVVIPTVSKVNEGVYQCQTSNLYGSGVAKFSKVVVIRRTEVNIASEDAKELSIHAGEKLKIPCNFNNDPLNRVTNIQWTKDGKPIEISAQDRIDFGIDGSITIADVQKRHEGNFVCNVTTVLDNASDFVVLDVVVNAPVITSHSDDQLIFTGDTVVFLCHANGIPEPNVVWKFNKTMTKTSGKEFKIEKAITTDTGNYTCIARNAYGETRQNMMLTVVGIPAFNLEHTIREGTGLLIPCVQPSEQVSLAWRHNGALILPSKSFVFSDKGLELTAVDEEHTGVYSCHIETVQGHKRVLQTLVKLKPNILLSEGGPVDLKEGQDMNLKCKTIPGLDAKVLWKYEDQFFIQGGSRDIRKKGSLLTVSKVEPSDSGTYSCVAIATFGQDTIDYQVRINPIPQEVSASCDPSHIAKISDITTMDNVTVLVQWNLPSVNRSCYKHQKFSWWTNQSLSEFKEEVLPVEASQFQLTNLRPDVGYYVQVNLVAPFNQQSFGETRSFVVEPVSANNDFGFEEDSIPLFVLAAVIGVLLVLFLVLVCLFLKWKAISNCLNSKALKAKSKSNLHPGPSVYEIGPPSNRLSLQVNPDDFMQNLAPQWPEPEPAFDDQDINERGDETDAFLKPEARRHSRNSISSSWSSLFNVPNSGTESIRSSTVSSGAGGRVSGSPYKPSTYSKAPRVTFAVNGKGYRRDK